MWPAYGDLGAMAEGWDDYARGADPLRQTDDPSRYNYPRLWLAPSVTGLRSKDVIWLGALLSAAFFAAVALRLLRVARMSVVSLLRAPAVVIRETPPPVRVGSL